MEDIVESLGLTVLLLTYRLYFLCERKSWPEDARAYNELIIAWPEILAASAEAGHKGEQLGLDMFAE